MKIHKGYHIYGRVADSDPFIATTVRFRPAPGDYYVEVRTTFVSASSKEAKTLKTGRYAKPVAVVAAS